MGNTHRETDVLLGLVVKGWSDELPREWSEELPKDLRVWGVRLKYAIIAKIKNANMLQRIEYLTRGKVHMDQAVWLQKRE